MSARMDRVARIRPDVCHLGPGRPRREGALRRTVKVGDPAPDFELFGDRDPESGAYERYRLSEALKEGPIILHFFPAPFTRTCQLQMDEVRDRADDLYLATGV